MVGDREPCDVLCLGEVLFDVLGDCELPGGAPANVAFHAAALGARSGLISRVGDDARGGRLLRWLEEAHVDTRGVSRDPHAATGLVRVEFREDGPAYDIAAPVAWDRLEAEDGALDLARKARVLVLGTLAQRQPSSRSAIRALLTAGRAAGAKVVADLNLRAPFYDEEVVLWTLRHADVLKLNADELAIISEMLGARGGRRELFEGLVREFGLPAAVLTCGAEGAWFHEAGALWHLPALPVEVADTVGAGDAFTAVIVSSLAAGRTLREAAPWCIETSAFVASQHGATPPLSEQLVVRWRRAMSGG